MDAMVATVSSSASSVGRDSRPPFQEPLRAIARQKPDLKHPKY